MIRLQADLHTHTIASTHAYSTITENCSFAAKNGIKCVAMTDHAMTMPDAPHCWHYHNLKILPRKIEGVTVLKGAEANIIDYDGNIDIDDETLGYLEWVVASFHKYTCKPSTVEEHTRGYLSIAKNPIDLQVKFSVSPQTSVRLTSRLRKLHRLISSFPVRFLSVSATEISTTLKRLLRALQNVASALLLQRVLQRQSEKWVLSASQYASFTRADQMYLTLSQTVTLISSLTLLPTRRVLMTTATSERMLSETEYSM